MTLLIRPTYLTCQTMLLLVLNAKFSASVCKSDIWNLKARTGCSFCRATQAHATIYAKHGMLWSGVFLSVSSRCCVAIAERNKLVFGTWANLGLFYIVLWGNVGTSCGTLSWTLNLVNYSAFSSRYVDRRKCRQLSSTVESYITPSVHPTLFTTLWAVTRRAWCSSSATAETYWFGQEWTDLTDLLEPLPGQGLPAATMISE